MMFLGIDPGGSGGLALISERGKFVDFEPMPDTVFDLLSTVHALSRRDAVVHALLEEITPQPSRPGAPGWSSRGTATFFKNIGHLEAALCASRVQYRTLRGPAWQKIVGLAYPKLEKGERRDKNIAKARVAELFPTLENVTHAAADALLIAEACRRIHLGDK